MARPRKYPDELRGRAVRLVFESKRPIAHVAQDLGIHNESLRTWVRQAEADTGRRRAGRAPSGVGCPLHPLHPYTV